MTVAIAGMIAASGCACSTFGGVVFFLAIIGFCYSHSFALSECLAFFEGYQRDHDDLLLQRVDSASVVG